MHTHTHTQIHTTNTHYRDLLCVAVQRWRTRQLQLQLRRHTARRRCGYRCYCGCTAGVYCRKTMIKQNLHALQFPTYHSLTQSHTHAHTDTCIHLLTHTHNTHTYIHSPAHHYDKANSHLGEAEDSASSTSSERARIFLRRPFLRLV